MILFQICGLLHYAVFQLQRQQCQQRHLPPQQTHGGLWCREHRTFKWQAQTLCPWFSVYKMLFSSRIRCSMWSLALVLKKRRSFCPVVPWATSSTFLMLTGTLQGLQVSELQQLSLTNRQENLTFPYTVVNRFSRHRFSRKFQFNRKFKKFAATKYGSIRKLYGDQFFY